ncbi:MAG: serine protease [Bauldia sp.]|nr:MAG: serine protease [Bauldia sp.]
MASATDWEVSRAAQPQPGDYAYDLDRTLSSVVSVKTTVAADAFTADVLGTERSGHGVLIRPDGVVLTIGYLVTEAETIWLGLSDGRLVPGDVLGYDQESGFGLVQALARLDLPALELGDSSAVAIGQDVVTAAAGGRARSIAAQVVARQEFAGYWEYVLDEAIFTAPAHPYWGGTALIGPAGDVLGIGSLRLEQASADDGAGQINMIVPIDLLEPILDDLLTIGRPRRPPRPWLGLYAVDVDDSVVIAGLADNGPAERAGLLASDIVLAVAGAAVDDLAGFFRRVWSLGTAGVRVPLTISREGSVTEITINSADRNTFLKAPRVH